MIQRIQTVYFLLTIVTGVLFLSGPIIFFENGAFLSSSGIEAGEGVGNLLLSVLLLSIPVLSLFLIFLYKNRRLQMSLTLLLLFVIIFSVAYSGYLAYEYSNGNNTSVLLGYKLILPLLMIVFTLLAYRGIKKDENIVKSYDRLR